MIMNQNTLGEYKYESNYCNISREYLKPRIPKGQDMVKWAPFVTMPEQYEMLNQFKQDQNKIDIH